MRVITTNEGVSPAPPSKFEKKADPKEKAAQQVEKVVSNNYKFVLFNGNNSSVFRKVLLSRGNWEEIKENSQEEKSIFQNANFIWKSYNFSVRKYAIIDDIHRNYVLKQAVNHFENNRGMCTKTGLIRSLSSYYRHLDSAIQAKYSVFDTSATSFVLTTGNNDIEFISFMVRFNEIAKGNFAKEKVPKKHCQENIWLLKPADANQGRGIEILKSQKEIISSLVQKSTHTYWVIQKYIEKPLLYYGRKFDIRVWALVTKPAEVFIYKTGYIRTCCEEYNMQDSDPNLHLTNNFVQKHHQNYGQHEPGNTLPLDCLFDYIDEKFANDNPNKINLREQIEQRMKDLIIDTILSVKKSMISSKRYNNFELFGYDFLIDEDLRVWLIEANTNPYIGVPNDFIKELVPKMADDLVKIVVDPLFPPINPSENQSNDFELIYCENGSSFNNGQSKNVRQAFTVSPYPLQKFAQKSNRTQRQSQTTSANSYSQAVKSQPQIEQQANNDKQTEPESSQNTGSLQRSASAIRFMPQGNKAVSSPIASKRKIQESGSNNNSTKSSDLTIMIQQLENNNYMNANGSQNSRKNNEIDIKKNLKKQKTVEEQEQEEDIVNENINMQQSKENQPTSSAIIVSSTTATSVAYDPDQMYQNLKKLLNSYLYSDFQPFYQHINIILSKMMNWELMSEQELRVVVKTLRLILESRISNILVDQKYIDKLISIIDSQNHPIEIQEVSLEALCAITKTITNKVRIISKEIISLLIKISLSSCDDKEMEKYDRKIRILATNCLIHLGGIYNRRMYIPGETRDNDKIRRILIENGGLLSLLWIRKRVNDEEIKKIIQDFIDNLDLTDFEMQNNLIKKWRKILKNENKLKVSILKNNASETQLLNVSADQVCQNEKKIKEGGVEVNEKQVDSHVQNNQKEIATHKKNFSLYNPSNIKQNGNEVELEYPVFLFRLDYFDIEGSMVIGEEIYSSIKEQITKREKEEKLKRDIEIKKQQEQDDERRLVILERKAKIEEFQKKKEEEKIKRRLEEKKKEEKQKAFLELEERKRISKLEELQKRREELRKQQKMEEDKRKVQDDDVQKKQQAQLFWYKRQLGGNALTIEEQAGVPITEAESKNKNLNRSLKPQIELSYNQYILSKQKDGDSNNMFCSTMSNSIINITHNINNNSNNISSNLSSKLNNNSRSKLASLSNRNSAQSPSVGLQNAIDKSLSESLQFHRLSMKNQQLKDLNQLKPFNKITLKSPLSLSQSQNFTQENFKLRNQRQLSPIKIENNSQNEQQQTDNLKQIQEIMLENQENEVHEE